MKEKLKSNIKEAWNKISGERTNKGNGADRAFRPGKFDKVPSSDDVTSQDELKRKAS